MRSTGGDAYATGVALLAQRELTAVQLRARLARRGFAPEAIAAALARLTATGLLDDRRAARMAARTEAVVRLRGRARALAKARALGVSETDARAAVDAAFADLDEAALLERALARRLRGRSLDSLDARALDRLAAALVRQGFAPGAVLARLRRAGVDVADPE